MEIITQALQQLSAGDPVAFAIPVFVILIIIEAVIDAVGKHHWYIRKDAWASLSMGIGSVFINLAMKIFFFLVFTYLYQNFRLFNIPSQAWWSWVLILFADDFSFYWHHRSSHQIRILWAAHSNHHSSTCYNLTTALRQSWTEYIYKYIFWLWLPIVGFEPMQIFTMISCSLIYQFFLHTEAVGKLGFLEWFMNTPSHHRVHHATNVKYLDKNHAGIFIIWDRLFGTFIEEDEQDRPIFGLTKNVGTFNPIGIAFHEYIQIFKDMQQAPTWKGKLGYLLNPPGWRHDGKGSTTKELQG